MRTTCPRCTGTGETTHRHVERGRCFQCDGTGRVVLRRSSPRRVDHRPADQGAIVAGLRATYSALARQLSEGWSVEGIVADANDAAQGGDYRAALIARIAAVECAEKRMQITQAFRALGFVE